MKIGDAGKAYEELKAAAGEVLRANPNLPGWGSAWRRLEKAHKAALRSPLTPAPASPSEHGAKEED